MPRLFFALIAFLCVPTSAHAQSSSADRAKVAEVAQALEADPLGKRAKEQREWLMKWLIEAPDLTVKVCGKLLGPVFGAKKNYDSELFAQTLASAAAFMIAHPDQAKDDAAVYGAGLEGALRAYESILKSKPKAKWPFLDDLLEKRSKGELPAHVRQASRECR